MGMMETLSRLNGRRASSALPLSSTASAEIRYDVIDLGTLGNNWSAATAINNEGQIVGTCLDASGYFRAVLFDPTGGGNNIDLGEGIALSINDNGQIVGTSGYYPMQATIFDPTGGGENIYLGDWSDAHSINNSGQIVGVLVIQATLFDPTGAGNHIYMGEGTAYSINDIGQIVGHTNWPMHATLFDPTGGGVNIDLYLGMALSSASAINNSGQIVGNTWAYSGDPHYPQGAARAALFDITGQGNNIDLGTLDDTLRAMLILSTTRARLLATAATQWKQTRTQRYLTEPEVATISTLMI